MRSTAKTSRRRRGIDPDLRVLIEPNEEERRNGWTADKLTDYIEERTRAANGVIMHDPVFRPGTRPARQKRLHPHRWRKR